MVLELTYLVLSIVGLVLPYSQLIPFIAAHGIDLPLFWSELFMNRISTDFALDLITLSVVFWLFVFKEGTRLKMKFRWIYIVLNLIIGLSFALPVFLLMRSKTMSSELATYSEAKLSREMT